METPFSRLVIYLLLGFSPVVLCRSIISDFKISPLPQTLQAELKAANIWQPHCPVSLDELRLLKVSYYDLAGHPHHDGNIILHKTVAHSALNLFKKLYRKHFPFGTIDTLITYQGNWQRAEENNVTYGFLCNPSVSKGFGSIAYGQVITVNPALNPEISLISPEGDKSVITQPVKALFSVNRRLKLKGMSEPIEDLVKQEGFVRLDLSANQIGWKRFIFQGISQEKMLPILTVPPAEKKVPIQFSEEPLPLPLKEKLKAAKLWDTYCPVSLERLSLLTISYLDFNGKTQVGNLIVFDAAAPFVLDAFKELYQHQFPLEKLSPIPTVNAREETSAFVCRNIVGGVQSSLHSYGLAMDINISRNPYVGDCEIRNNRLLGSLIPSGPTSLSYLNRSYTRPGMNETIVDIMAKHGFIAWGGEWQDRIDYMHFQVPRNIAVNSIWLDKNSANQLIALSIQYPKAAKKMSIDEKWRYLYQFNPPKYIQVLKKYFPLLETESEAKVINRIYLALLN
jgi:D-alanyl-D-alanine carboxypeptidase